MILAGLVVPLVIAGHPAVRPWPIGVGVRYRPPATPALVEAGRPLGGLRCGALGPRYAVHLEIFVDRRAVVVPAGIGVASPARRSGATVAPRGCTYPLVTLTPTGIVEVARGVRLRLADLFRLWGQTLGPRRIASFHSGSPVRAYLDGVAIHGAPAAMALTRHAEIVLELGGYVPPHSFFLFPGGDS